MRRWEKASCDRSRVVVLGGISRESEDLDPKWGVGLNPNPAKPEPKGKKTLRMKHNKSIHAFIACWVELSLRDGCLLFPAKNCGYFSEQKRRKRDCFSGLRFYVWLRHKAVAVKTEGV